MGKNLKGSGSDEIEAPNRPGFLSNIRNVTFPTKSDEEQDQNENKVTPSCSSTEVNRRFSRGKASSSAYSLLHADFLLGLLFNPEDGGSVEFQQTSQSYIPEYRTLQKQIN
jgi:hypothetical protein